MKTFFIVFLSIFFLNGCAQKDAFSRFHLTKEQELSENSIQVLKIKDFNQNILGMASALYLNEIYPKRYSDGEYFYVYYYIKDKSKIEFILNNQPAIKVEKLKTKNQFSKLLNIKSSWHSYYLVKFEKTEDIKLTLQLKAKNFLSKGFVYKKED